MPARTARKPVIKAEPYQAPGQRQRTRMTNYGYVYEIAKVVKDKEFIQKCELAAQAGQIDWLRAVWRITQLEEVA
jgi:hypothetical protein